MVEQRNRENNGALLEAVREVSGTKSGLKLVPVDHDPFARRGKAKQEAVRELLETISGTDDEVVMQLRLINTNLARLLERPLPKMPAPEVNLSAVVAAIRSIPSASAVDLAPLIAAVAKNTEAIEALCHEVRTSAGSKPKARRRTVRMGRDAHGSLIAVVDEVADAAAARH